jgi:hypothetical protein
MNGHTPGNGRMRNTYNISAGKPEEKKPHGRSKE